MSLQPLRRFHCGPSSDWHLEATMQQKGRELRRWGSRCRVCYLYLVSRFVVYGAVFQVFSHLILTAHEEYATITPS